jgi:hypothetical protein
MGYVDSDKPRNKRPPLTGLTGEFGTIFFRQKDFNLLKPLLTKIERCIVVQPHVLIGNVSNAISKRWRGKVPCITVNEWIENSRQPHQRMGNMIVAN